MVNEAEYAQPELHNGLESIARGKITASGDWMNHHEKFRRPLLFRLCGNILFLNIFCI